MITDQSIARRKFADESLQNPGCLLMINNSKSIDECLRLNKVARLKILPDLSEARSVQSCWVWLCGAVILVIY
jgi:hypothetical protein